MTTPFEKGKQDCKLGISLTDGKYVLPHAKGSMWPTDYDVLEWQRGWMEQFAMEKKIAFETLQG